MNYSQFWDPFAFQPTKFNGSAAPNAVGGMGDKAILGDYYRRVLRTNVFPKDPDDDTDRRSAEEKARLMGKEHVIKPERKMPHDLRPDPYEHFMRKPLPIPAFEEEERDVIDPFGARQEALTSSLPTILDVKKKMKIPKEMRRKKPPKLHHHNPKSRRPPGAPSRKRK